MAEASSEQGKKLPIAFLLRRAHSLSGLVPVGMFLCVHLFANFQMLLDAVYEWIGRPEKAYNFQHDVNFIHNMPGLLFIEIALWSSIGFHAILGLYYTFVGSKTNVSTYNWQGNVRYTLQRVTGIIALLFIFFHVATLRWQWPIGPYIVPFYGKVDGVEMANVSVYYALTAAPWAFAVYFIGTAAAVYHFANGLWTMAITWGVTISAKAQQRWGYACAGLGVALTVFFIGALFGAAQLSPTDDEKRLYQLESGRIGTELTDVEREKEIKALVEKINHSEGKH